MREGSCTRWIYTSILRQKVRKPSLRFRCTLSVEIRRKTRLTNLSKLRALHSGGGAISKETFITTLIISNSLFGLQFLLIPEFFLTQFFDKTWDDHHIFFARFMGVLILGNSALLKVCDPEVTFPVAAITQAAVALVGPLKAQFTLGPKMPIHLVPVIATTVTTGMALLAM